jgi:hypothetical protein
MATLLEPTFEPLSVLPPPELVTAPELLPPLPRSTATPPLLGALPPLPRSTAPAAGDPPPSGFCAKTGVLASVRLATAIPSPRLMSFILRSSART